MRLKSLMTHFHQTDQFIKVSDGLTNPSVSPINQDPVVTTYINYFLEILEIKYFSKYK